MRRPVRHIPACQVLPGDYVLMMNPDMQPAYFYVAEANTIGEFTRLLTHPHQIDGYEAYDIVAVVR